MNLYKYTSFEIGLNIIKSNLIRFTQLPALNDIQEIIPALSLEMNLDLTKQMYTELLSQGVTEKIWNEIVIDHYNKLDDKTKEFMSFEFVKSVFNKMFKTFMSFNHNNLPAIIQKEFERNKEQSQQKIIRQFIDVMGFTVGILSLSSKNNHHLMWANYADSSRGIAIIFDKDHSYFKDVKKIIYSDKKFLINMNDFIDKPESISQEDRDKVFTTKYFQWEYEDEYRLFKLLNDHDESDGNDSFNYKIYLFKIPKDCIKGVILGARISEDNSKTIMDIMKLEYPSCKVYQAKGSLGNFNIIIDNI